MRKCLPRGGGDLWRLDRLAFCSLPYKSESYWTTCWRSNAKPMSELRNQCTYYFMIWRLPAPSISVGLGTVEAGPPEASIVAGILWNNNFQCVINEHSDLGTHHRNPQNIWALGVCSQVADAASLSPVEWNRAKIMHSYRNTALYLYLKMKEARFTM